MDYTILDAEGRKGYKKKHIMFWSLKHFSRVTIALKIIKKIANYLLSNYKVKIED